jgi:hypothetical protein
MLNQKHDTLAQPGAGEPAPRNSTIWKSIWVVIGFLLWVGFFIGAVIMHAMNK